MKKPTKKKLKATMWAVVRKSDDHMWYVVHNKKQATWQKSCLGARWFKVIKVEIKEL